MKKLRMDFFSQKSPFEFVILLGIVSLFSDAVFEGAHSIIGPYLLLLGASGTVVGFVAGFGEFIGYALRFFSGYLVDRTSRYWFIAILGYFFIIAIPLLAFAVSWKMAAVLIIIERIGKAIRIPSRDAMLSYASQKMGRGFGFGLHQLLDQVGGVVGPLLITFILFFKHDYRIAFLFLIIPGVCTLLTLLFARKTYPYPQDLEIETTELKTTGIPSLFWVYLVGIACVAAGYADFPLIAFHFQKKAIIPAIWIPVFYIIAMGCSAASALIFGKIYDRDGCFILIFAFLLSALFPPFVFLGEFWLALFGMILWGLGMGAQRSLIKAVIGDMVSKQKRGSAYGIFNTAYGVAWFLGSALMGFFYDVSIHWLIIFSVVIQLCSIPFIYVVQRRLK